MAETTATTATGKSTGLAVVAYLFGLISGIIIYLISKDKFLKFHALQSILFSVVWAIIGWILTAIPGIGGVLDNIVNLVLFIVWIVLMVKAYKGEEYKLPVIGDLAAKNS